MSNVNQWEVDAAIQAIELQDARERREALEAFYAHENTQRSWRTYRRRMWFVFSTVFAVGLILAGAFMWLAGAW